MRRWKDEPINCLVMAVAMAGVIVGVLVLGAALIRAVI